MSTPDDDATRITRRTPPGHEPDDRTDADADADADDTVLSARQRDADDTVLRTRHREAAPAEDSPEDAAPDEDAPDEDTAPGGHRRQDAPAPGPEADATVVSRHRPGDDDATRVTRRPVDDDATRVVRRPVDDDATRVVRRPRDTDVDDATARSTRSGTRTVSTPPEPTARTTPVRTPAVRSAPPAGPPLPAPPATDGGAAARAERLRTLRTRLLILAGVSLLVLAGSVAGLVLLLTA